jgi:glycosyltransferase involved in cell wall biosynthesis
VRVLWVGHNLAYPPKGGPLQRNYNLLRQAAKSCEVHVLAFDQPAIRPAGISPQDCARALAEFCTVVDWLPLSTEVFKGQRYWLAMRGLASRDPFVIHWLRSNEMMERLRKILHDFPFDVVHFDTLGLAQYRLLVKSAGTVLNHHDIDSSMMSLRAINDLNMFRRRYWAREARKLREAEQRWCPQFGVNLVVSREDEKLLADSRPGIETTVVPNGVDTDYFTLRPDPAGRTLLFCGSLDWHPNREAMKFFFDSIWPRLIRQLGHVEIYVVGRGPPKWLERLSANDNRIHVTGFVDDVRPYFRKATMFVCPIRHGGGTRLKILDALAMGVPVIATSFACSGLSLENGKHVVLAETPEDFVFQIGHVLSNATLRVSLAAAGRAIVERTYSWNVIGRSLIAAYETASRSRRGISAIREDSPDAIPAA